MQRNRLFQIFAFVAVAALVGCERGDTDTTVDADTSFVTQPDTERVEVMVPTEDTLMVERRQETTVTVDTTRVEGRDTVRRDTVRR